MAVGQPLCLQRAQGVAGQAAFRRRHRGQGAPEVDRAVAYQAQAPISCAFGRRAAGGPDGGPGNALPWTSAAARSKETPTWRILVTKLPKKPVIWVSQAR